MNDRSSANRRSAGKPAARLLLAGVLIFSALLILFSLFILPERLREQRERAIAYEKVQTFKKNMALYEDLLNRMYQAELECLEQEGKWCHLSWLLIREGWKYESDAPWLTQQQVECDSSYPRVGRWRADPEIKLVTEIEGDKLRLKVQRDGYGLVREPDGRLVTMVPHALDEESAAAER